jgi:hypothetical protein
MKLAADVAATTTGLGSLEAIANTSLRPVPFGCREDPSDLQRPILPLDLECRHRYSDDEAAFRVAPLTTDAGRNSRGIGTASPAWTV